MSLESVWGLISCPLKQRSRSVETAMLFGALCRKMNLLCGTPLPCYYCQSQLNLVCVSESMCAQGQRVYLGRVLRRSSHMRSNLNKLHIFVP